MQVLVMLPLVSALLLTFVSLVVWFGSELFVQYRRRTEPWPVARYGMHTALMVARPATNIAQEAPNDPLALPLAA